MDEQVTDDDLREALDLILSSTANLPHESALITRRLVQKTLLLVADTALDLAHLEVARHG